MKKQKQSVQYRLLLKIILAFVLNFSIFLDVKFRKGAYLRIFLYPLVFPINASKKYQTLITELMGKTVKKSSTPKKTCFSDPPQLLSQSSYECECILDVKIHNGKRFYLIKWRGFTDADNTWEPIENLDYILEDIIAFEREKKPLTEKMEQNWRKNFKDGKVKHPLVRFNEANIQKRINRIKLLVLEEDNEEDNEDSLFVKKKSKKSIMKKPKSEAQKERIRMKYLKKKEKIFNVKERKRNLRLCTADKERYAKRNLFRIEKKLIKDTQKQMDSSFLNIVKNKDDDEINQSDQVSKDNFNRSENISNSESKLMESVSLSKELKKKAKLVNNQKNLAIKIPEIAQPITKSCIKNVGGFSLEPSSYVEKSAPLAGEPQAKPVKKTFQKLIAESREEFEQLRYNDSIYKSIPKSSILEGKLNLKSCINSAVERTSIKYLYLPKKNRERRGSRSESESDSMEAINLDKKMVIKSTPIMELDQEEKSSSLLWKSGANYKEKMDFIDQEDAQNLSNHQAEQQSRKDANEKNIAANEYMPQFSNEKKPQQQQKQVVRRNEEEQELKKIADSLQINELQRSESDKADEESNKYNQKHEYNHSSWGIEDSSQRQSLSGSVRVEEGDHDDYKEGIDQILNNQIDEESQPHGQNLDQVQQNDNHIVEEPLFIQEEANEHQDFYHHSNKMVDKEQERLQNGEQRQQFHPPQASQNEHQSNDEQHSQYEQQQQVLQTPVQYARRFLEEQSQSQRDSQEKQAESDDIQIFKRQKPHVEVIEINDSEQRKGEYQDESVRSSRARFIRYPQANVIRDQRLNNTRRREPQFDGKSTFSHMANDAFATPKSKKINKLSSKQINPQKKKRKLKSNASQSFNSSSQDDRVRLRKVPLRYQIVPNYTRILNNIIPPFCLNSGLRPIVHRILDWYNVENSMVFAVEISAGNHLVEHFITYKSLRKYYPKQLLSYLERTDRIKV